jgi:hypothetical protein
MRLGIDRNAVPLCIVMPRFDKMDDDEAYAIAEYLRSLPAVRRAIPPSRCPPLKPRPDGGADGAAKDAEVD